LNEKLIDLFRKYDKGNVELNWAEPNQTGTHVIMWSREHCRVVSYFISPTPLLLSQC
jgi:hypothetical protein